MFVLGIDTATKVAGAAVVNADRLVAERFVHNQKTHSQNIIPMIQQVMADAGIKPSELYGIAVTEGPGSFTGLRIGMAVAKSMGLVLNVPVVGISTLKALAWNLVGIDGLICPILDARKNEVYTCLYRSASKSLEEIISPTALNPGSLINMLDKYRQEKVTFIGDAVPVYGEAIREKIGQRALFGTMTNSYPRAAAVAELGLFRLREGRVSDATFMQPVYLRKSEAELTWEEKHGSTLCSPEKRTP